MATYWYSVLLCCGFVTLTNGLFRTRGLLPPLEDPNKVLGNYVKENDYPFELHFVTTKDGYVLALHRIPPSDPNKLNIPNRRVVLIMHGLLGSSADWIITGRNRSIAFLLSDNGYDVWLGNARGSTNSKNHTKLSIQSAKFWDFSWHEMGLYDTPAMIDYILEYTSQKKLFYIGFSQGTTQFWVTMSLMPEYNEKIKLMSALAPVAYTGHITGLLKTLSYLAYFFRGLYKYTGYFELLSSTFLMKRMSYAICRKGVITQPLCEILIYLVGGFSKGEFDHVDVGKFLQFTPAGCSFKQLVHYAMGVQNPGHFRSYDYGMLSNIRNYRRIVPPEYPVHKITAPIVLYVGLNDWLGHPKDVEILKKKLPNLVEEYTVTLKKLNHFDFLFGLHIRDLVYEHVIEKMNSIP
ncbi:lipase 3-like [Odontomachus brunneus]|uniref:lipase 3-like n=1 Tax=Odontomachus brunneus TaxID=486640 RepID=UPI0013F293E7|nr:lipase 3-like [Odontomachus brunneus]XP_032677314.1 lipase 3-like [Odontomachus brunneus]XP_032677315.1 lipase 3-like [Odontomachus brunneus]